MFWVFFTTPAATERKIRVVPVSAYLATSSSTLCSRRNLMGGTGVAGGSTVVGAVVVADSAPSTGAGYVAEAGAGTGTGSTGNSTIGAVGDIPDRVPKTALFDICVRYSIVRTLRLLCDISVVIVAVVFIGCGLLGISQQPTNTCTGSTTHTRTHTHTKSHISHTLMYIHIY